jgi:hypothetical protein
LLIHFFCGSDLFDHQLLFGLLIFRAAVLPFNRVANVKANEEAARAFGLGKFLFGKWKLNLNELLSMQIIY